MTSVATSVKRYDVARDFAGIELAALEMMERGLLLKYHAKHTPSYKLPPPQLADGYYEWAQHLQQVEASGIAPADLLADEARGLRAIAAARAEYAARHPECQSCRAPRMTREANVCWRCSQPVHAPAKTVEG